MEILDNVSVNTIIWSVIAILEVVVRLTPSTKDNSILNKVLWVVEKLVPNKSKTKKVSHKLFKN
tara:strand:+ start:16722 stop:16913 length:192 start_codon:yes stop_codon:yes gene_type:complete